MGIEFLIKIFTKQGLLPPNTFRFQQDLYCISTHDHNSKFFSLRSKTLESNFFLNKLITSQRVTLHYRIHLVHQDVVNLLQIFYLHEGIFNVGKDILENSDPEIVIFLHIDQNVLKLCKIVIVFYLEALPSQRMPLRVRFILCSKLLKTVFQV